MKEATYSSTWWIILTTKTWGQRRLPESVGSLHSLLRCSWDLSWPWSKCEEPYSRLHHFWHAHLCDHQQLAIKESKSDIALSGGKQCHSIKPEEKQFYNLEINKCFGYAFTYLHFFLVLYVSIFHMFVFALIKRIITSFSPSPLTPINTSNINNDFIKIKSMFSYALITVVSHIPVNT